MEKASGKATLKDNVRAWLLLLPGLIFLFLFTYVPVWQTTHLSFFEANLAVKEPQFAGLANYQELAGDEVFWKVLGNTVWFVVGTVPFSMALALMMAIFVNRVFRLNRWFRVFFFYPAVIPAIAVANIWLFIYTPEYGLLSRFLQILHIPDMNWLGTASTVLPATIVMAVWKEAGLYMVFYLAGLQNISRDLYEAAKLDGATSWSLFRNITFPLLMPSTLFIFILASINAFKLVDHLVIMTQGGPDNESNLLLYYIYQTAFAFWDQGKAATLTVILVVMLLLLASVQFFGLDKKIHYR